MFFFRDGIYTPDLPSIAGLPEVEDFIGRTVSSEYRKEDRDWVVLYNSKVKKTLDINLVQTFAHAR